MVGIAGFMLPALSAYFKMLTPLVLILNVLLLGYFHKEIKNLKNLIVFFSIFAGGILIEIIGVQTGIIFGNYHYGDGLGWKIFDTPVLIGINWLFLSYTSSTLFENIKINLWLKVLFSSTIMVIYDIVLEKVAPHLDMWYWENDKIPLQNYLAWFVISFIFIALLKIFKVNTSNKISSIVLLSQFAFFVILAFYFN